MGGSTLSSKNIKFRRFKVATNRLTHFTLQLKVTETVVNPKSFKAKISNKKSDLIVILAADKPSGVPSPCLTQILKIIFFGKLI